MKLEVVMSYIDKLNPKGELDWLKSKLQSNLSYSNDRILSLEDIYVGTRDTDLGWVLGYQTVSGGILDIGMLADWYCRDIREVKLQDIKHIRDLDNGNTFDPINKDTAKAIHHV